MYDSLEKAWQELTAEGAQFEIEEVEIGGTRLRCFKTAPNNLRDVWLFSKAFGDQEYLVYNQDRWTYSMAHAQVASIANWLKDSGVAPGDRVGIAMRNYPEWLLSYWATLSIGASVVGLNAWWVEPEIMYALNDSQPKVLICDQERLERFWKRQEEFPPGMKVVVARPRGDMPMWTVDWIDLISTGGDLPTVDIDPDSDACIFYTSGTTGVPKGAQLTHRGCVTNIVNMMFSGLCAARMEELRGIPMPAPESLPPPAALITTPLFHVTANNCAAHIVTLQGGKLVMMYRWDPEIALDLIEQEAISSVSSVPVMTRELVTHPDFAKTNTSSLRAVGGGGAALQPDLVSKISEAVTTGQPSTGYGMTETCGIITAVSGELFIDKPESCGRILPTFEAKLMDDSDQEVPAGEIGELWVKGSPVIRGYLNKPEDTAESITDGWLHTGDLARIDEQGFVYIVDRKKDMVLRGGENVYCVEVENAIFAHPDVAECATFAVPDERVGEEVGAAILLAEGAQADADVIRNHCKNLIASFKIPRYFWFLDEPLPRNANGKFMKRQLQRSLDVKDAS